MNGTVSRQLYCVIPQELAADLHPVLCRYWGDDPSITVVVEQRQRERRSPNRSSGRRADDTAPTAHDAKRRIRNSRGRRVADRRATVVEWTLPELPASARPAAHRLVFLERLEPSAQHARDIDTDRVVIAVQGGDEGAFKEIYLRYFDAVYVYARVVLREHHEAEDAVQEVFVKAMRELSRYEVRPGMPFRAWLMQIARNHTIDLLRKRGRLEFRAPDHMDRTYEALAVPDEATGPDWLADSDLAMFVQRLPLAQRQALVLRYRLDFSTNEIATALERSPMAVRLLEHRALRSLESRLVAIGRQPKGGPRSTRDCRTPMLVRVRGATVLRGRRFALVNGSALPASLNMPHAHTRWVANRW